MGYSLCRIPIMVGGVAQAVRTPAGDTVAADSIVWLAAELVASAGGAEV